MKVFLCSTSRDLEDLRALIVDRFGAEHEFIHFEDAAFPSRRGLHSHDQCIEAVKQAEVVICIIDRRYGGRYHGDRPGDFPRQSVEIRGTFGRKSKRVEVVVPTAELSISWCELIAAYGDGKYVITFARQRALDEKATRRKNQGLKSFKPAHVDNNHVFDLLDWITKQRKDNWIIPFHTAVDLLEKLDRWLAVADSSIVPPTPVPTPAPVGPRLRLRVSPPITVIVEGESDAGIVSAIARALQLRSPLTLAIAGGKRNLFGNLARCIAAYKESTGIVVLADADTDDASEIEAQEAQFRQIVSSSARPDTRVVFAVPQIEAWLDGIDFPSERIRRDWLMPNAPEELQAEIIRVADQVPSLAEFISVLQELEAKA